MFISLIFVIVINIAGYLLIKEKSKNLKISQEKIFYELTFYAQNFLYEIFKEYENKKEDILKDHNFVLDHLNENFGKLKNKLGSNYHIFLTDENFTITKTTFKYDQNFSLAFVKDFLIKHKKPFISPPICEMATTEFISFSDSYQNNRVLQIGYIFNSSKINHFKNKIKEIKNSSPFIKDINIYFIYPQIHFASKCQILTPLYRKYTLKEMQNYKTQGLKLFSLLKNNNPFKINNNFYLLTSNPLDPKGFLIFEIKTTPYIKNFTQKIKTIGFIFIFLILGMIFIINLYINKIISNLKEFTEHIKNEKEFNKKISKDIDIISKAYNQTLNKLKSLNQQKEEFLQFAMHELKTPLSILALTNLDDIQKSALNRLILSANKMESFLE